MGAPFSEIYFSRGTLPQKRIKLADLAVNTKSCYMQETMENHGLLVFTGGNIRN